jgi:hypothetical protein
VPSALELRWSLRLLQRRYGIAPTPHIVPPIAPVPYAVVLVGTAATTDLDLDHMQLRPFAFGALPPTVPLLLRHDPATVAGTVQELAYDHNGGLRVRVRVEHEEARRLGAFSVGARIIECMLADGDSERFRGVLERVELTEVSLTDRPSNPRALVVERIPAAISDWYTLMQRRVECIGKYLELAVRLHAQADI